MVLTLVVCNYPDSIFLESSVKPNNSLKSVYQSRLSMHANICSLTLVVSTKLSDLNCSKMSTSYPGPKSVVLESSAKPNIAYMLNWKLLLFSKFTVVFV